MRNRLKNEGSFLSSMLELDYPAGLIVQKDGIINSKVVFLLTVVAFCLFESIIDRQSSIFHEYEAVLLLLRCGLLTCIAIWCFAFIFLTFTIRDVPLIGLLLIAITAYIIDCQTALQTTDAIVLIGSMTLGKFVFVLLQRDRREANSITNNRNLRIRFFIGLVLLLTFSSWWHLDLAKYFYPGTRWTGLWDNPNDYGMLMGAGVVLAIGLLAVNQKLKIRNRKLATVLLIATGMMGVGLLFSYSRGAWLGTAIGLLYLAKAYGKFKWRWVLPPVLLAAAVACFFWGSTPDTAPWFVKRLDLGRPSAQNRVVAWKTGFEMMRDHPLGVGWNKTVDIYEANYSPPKRGSGAITTNDYLMLGTQLGLPGLLCFVAYVALCFKSPRFTVHSPQSAKKAEGRNHNAEMTLDSGLWTPDWTKVACRAGALVFLVGFWFDGGLFKLATASVFWILLELSQVRNAECGVRNQTDLNLVTSAATK